MTKEPYDEKAHLAYVFVAVHLRRQDMQLVVQEIGIFHLPFVGNRLTDGCRS